MRDKVINGVMKPGRFLGVATLYLILSLYLASWPQSLAQDMKIISKDTKAPIIQMFYPEKNETAIVAPIGAVEDIATMGMSPLSMQHPSRRNLLLETVQYIYPGKNPTRPQSVSFTFFVRRPEERYKENRSFIISAEDKVVQQGDFVLEDKTYKGDKKPETRKVLTVMVSTDIFLSLVEAKKVRIKVGEETYKLTGDQLKHLQALAKTIETLNK